jgi:alkanesulfonate monooxygenase SsuD/methylene tetrahydromethanopterin reductase-like flavin-dependent oxidoreductase (luciferase family)
VEEALDYRYTPEEAAFVEQYTRVCVDGDPQQVKDGILQVAENYQTNDLSVVTICHGFAERLRSYELVAEVCGIRPDRAGPPLS